MTTSTGSRPIPSDADSLMASALLAISRATESSEEGNPEENTKVDCTTGSTLSADFGRLQRTEKHFPTTGNNFARGGLKPLYLWNVASHVQPQLSSIAGFGHCLEGKVLLSGVSSFPTSPKIESLEASIISDEAISASLLKRTSCASGIPIGGNVFFPLLVDGDASQQKTKNIRRQEIVKALLSKPQRGRKRANLNDVERLELTRTRNREHAKSTRVRKKMRYEELLNCENALRVNQIREDLDTRRRDCVVNLLSVREQMLQNCFLSSRFGDDIHVRKLGVLVKDIDTLIFDDGSFQSENHFALDQMNQFDVALSTSISSKCICHHDATFADFISYKIKGASPVNEIALTNVGSAFVEMDVVMKTGGNADEIIQSYVLKVKFAPESDKICAVYMREMKISWKEQEKPRQILENQISHPSVVSFEAEKDQRRELGAHFDRRAESDDGVGSGLTF